jgi:hypothetical protein
MKRTLYIHIGAHRTATSSIQNFMKKNTDLLPEQGFFNPYAGTRHLGLIKTAFETGVDDVSVDLNQRADKKGHPIHSICISDEDICSRPDLTPLKAFDKYFDVKIVFFLRRQDLWIESWYQQNTKWQWNPSLAHLTFPEFLARRSDFFWIDYAERLGHLSSLFGQENILCRSFEKRQMPDGPIKSFCDTLGLNILDGFDMGTVINQSLSPLITEFMRNLPLSEVPDKQRREFEWACSIMDREIKARSSLYMDATTRTALMQEYAIGNDAVAQQFFGRDQLFLEPLPALDAELAQTELPKTTKETMETLITPFVHAMTLVRLRMEAIDAKTPKS